jgi:signal transduction histidine kinase
MFRRNIVFKLTIGYILIALISTLLIGTLFIGVFQNYTMKNRQRNILQRASEISRMVAPYLSKGQSLPEYADVLKLVDSSANARVWIAGRDGSILEMSGGSTVSGSYNISQYDSELAGQILGGQEVVKEEYNSFYGEDMLTAGVPVRGDANSIAGMVLLHSPMSGITSIVDRVFYVMLLFIVFEIVFSGLLGFYLSKSIAKPLKLMNQTAMEMTNGNYKAVTGIYQKDEIGELAGSLDMLALKLDYTIGELFREKSKLNDLFLSMAEGILAFDPEMKLVNHNGPAQSLLGYEVQELVQSLEEAGLLADFKSVMEDAQRKAVTRNWGDKVLRFSISPVMSGDNETGGVVVLIQDISEQERLEQMRRDFIANVSHEFRTPLTLIKGSLESLIDRAVSQNEIEGTYSRLLDETDRLQRMVNDLLDLSKLQSGKADFVFEKLDLTSLISDTARTMQFIADKRDIKLQLNLPENIPPVYGDYDKLKQLLIIFIDNAVKYSHISDKIYISSEADDYAYVEIRDNGIGISKDDLPHIWDRFYMADKSRGRSIKGTGLGLSIAKYLIELSKGTVNIESEQGKGTKIRIGLPLYKEGNL